MSSEFQRCLDNRKLMKFKATLPMIEKELTAAKYDLKRARISLQNGDSKWATIQGYYVMFHSARALLFKRGYREKSHRCLLTALQELYIDKGELPVEYGDYLKTAMDLREDADYGYIYDDRSAQNLIDNATKFHEYVKKLL